MKRTAFLKNGFILIIAMTLFAASCKKDTDKADDLVGTWTAGTTTLTMKVGNKTLTQYFADTYGLTADQAQVYSAVVEQTVKQGFAGTIKVNSDNTYNSTLGGVNETGTWSLNSDRTKLTITPANDTPTTFDVVQLTSSTLKLHVAETTQEDLNDDGTPETLDLAADLNFTK
jgi:hypothetical protein